MQPIDFVGCAVRTIERGLVRTAHLQCFFDAICGTGPITSLTRHRMPTNEARFCALPNGIEVAYGALLAST